MLTNSGYYETMARDYIDDLAARGVHHFTIEDLAKTSGKTHAAAKLALRRLAKQGLVASPARGFYVIVPPEYKRLGCLPADQFIPALMQKSGIPYYAGLLSAAQYYGAAHHRPQEFQVLVARPRRPIVCGSVRVAFFVNKHIDEIPTQNFNTPRGTIRVSTAEATAFDLVGYAGRIGGLDQAATVIAELAEQLDPERMLRIAVVVPVPWTQRLGYLLELAGHGGKVRELGDYVRRSAKDTAPLLTGASVEGAAYHKDWRLALNTEVDIET